MKRWVYVSEVNGIPEIEINASRRVPLWKRALISWMDRSIYRLSTVLIAVSPELRCWLKTACNIPGHRIHVVPNGVNARVFRPMHMDRTRVQLGWRNDLYYVGYVGSMAPWQGVDIFIQSAAYVLKEIDNIHFIVGGDGQLRGRLEEMVRQKGIEGRFSFLGTIPYTEAPLYIGACDITVAPFPGSSRNIITGLSPLKIYAYMSCARPIVTTDMCGLDKIVGETGAGLVVDPDDPKGFAMAIVSLLRNDELRNRMGARGRALVLRDFTWRRSAERIVEVLEGILKP
jgi:glycosyltransferase involved in cell wall biosynthesis